MNYVVEFSFLPLGETMPRGHASQVIDAGSEDEARSIACDDLAGFFGPALRIEGVREATPEDLEDLET